MKAKHSVQKTYIFTWSLINFCCIWFRIPGRKERKHLLNTYYDLDVILSEVCALVQLMLSSTVLGKEEMQLDHGSGDRSYSDLFYKSCIVMLFYLSTPKATLNIIKLVKSCKKNECFSFCCVFLNIFSNNN